MTDIDFNQQVAKVELLLRLLALNYTKDSTSAQDLQQDTLLKAYRARNRFQEGSNFKAWVTTIMRNAFINNYRKQKVRRALAHPLELQEYHSGSCASVQNEGSQSLISNEIIGCINRLSTLYSVPFLMHYQGYEYQEIAAQLSLPIGTVKSRIFMARKQPKKRLVQYA